ncbi:MAG: Do family serine endopeptidase [Candidatus Zixiibacteriota bacterium]
MISSLGRVARLRRLGVIGAVVIASLWTGFSGYAGAQLAPRGGWTDESGHSPFVRVVNQVKDAVVNISAERVVDRYHSGRLDPFFEDWFGPREDRDERSRQKSLGSGFIFRADGYILTNYHVINGADDVTVRLSDKMELPAEIVGSDPATDLAVLRIRADHELPFVPLGDSDSLLVGDWVVAIGNPFPNQSLDRTVTVGVISAMGRKDLWFGDETPTYQNYIQTDASINPGNSGGPLVGLNGEVIGINAAIASPTGSSVGIGFAIPVNFAKMVIPDLMAEGAVSRGWLGIQPRDLEWDDVEAEGLQSADGVIVNRVIEKTPAEAAGLRVGDVILKLNGTRVQDAQHFMQLIWQAKVGANVHLDVLRRGSNLAFDVRLGDRNAYLATAEQQTDMPAARPNEPLLGLEVVTSTPERAEEYGVVFNPGVIVTEVDEASHAYEKGIRVGNIIGEIDHVAIKNRADFVDVAAKASAGGKPVSLLVYDRRGSTGYFAVRPETRN